jgi:cysteinyl-tRNA synthetase
LSLRLFNSMGRRLEPFKAVSGKQVRMYTCGPTVWNYAHIGNFRTFTFEDILRRYLKFKGFKVTQVMNITDIDDKIIKGMKQTGKSREELSLFYEEAFFEDLRSLNIERAEVYPRASANIKEMVSLIVALVEHGYAYRADDGSYYYDVSRFKDYGRLSGIKPSRLKPGARVSSDDYSKEEANDFALWKAWDPDDGDVFWETELGKGRPGWHIECSAMSMKYLGESFDIHTGGKDHLFPHHENEIAQSEPVTGKRLANFWLHSEFLSVTGAEMHKSEGNIVTLKELTDDGWDPLTVRMFLISAHYRDPIDLTDDSLGQADAGRERLQELVARLQAREGGASLPAGRKLASLLNSAFTAAMDDDLDTPVALAQLFKFVSAVNKTLDGGEGEAGFAPLLEALEGVNSVLGVLRFEKRVLPADVNLLIESREEARRAKDFQKADEIRAKLAAMGYEVEDTPRGPQWKKRSPG